MNRSRTVLTSLIVALLFVMVIGNSVTAYDGYHHEVRVLIGQSSSVSATVTSGSYQVLNQNGGYVSTVSAGSSASLSQGMTLSSVDGNGRFSWNGTEYRGDLVLAGGNVVNHLGMEEYLYSVVMMELGAGAPGVEALKAQAIACRNFAFYRLENPRNTDYDLNRTSDQSYGGYTSEKYNEIIGARVREAVDGTRDQVMFYDGKLIVANYMANAGGHTENGENVWGGNSPYLMGIRCPWDAYPYIADTGSYTALKMPNGYEWTYMISCSDLAAKVPSIGSVTDVTVDHGDCVSGYVSSVTVWGTKGSKSYTGAQFRSLLGLRSSSFEIMVDKSIASKQYASSDYISTDSFDTAFDVSGNMITIYGKGYGHSVGMSQWSACVMADEGYDYRYILNYFYNQNLNNGRLVIRSY